MQVHKIGGQNGMIDGNILRKEFFIEMIKFKNLLNLIKGK
jgi:hypothetical protein